MNQGLESYAKLIELDIGDLVKAYININKNNANLHIVTSLTKSIGLCPIDLKLFFNLQDINKKTDFGKGTYLNYYSYVDGAKGKDINVTSPTGLVTSYLVKDNYYNKDTKLRCKLTISDDKFFEFKDKIGNSYNYYEDYNSNYPSDYLFKSGDNINFSVTDENITIYNNHSDKFDLLKNNNHIVYEINNYHDNNIIESVSISYDNNFNISNIKILRNGSTIKSASFKFLPGSIEVIDDISLYRIKFLYLGNRVIKYLESYNEKYDNALITKIEYYNNYSVIENYKGSKTYSFFDNFDLPTFDLDEYGNLNLFKYDSESNLLKFKSNLIKTKKISNLLDNNDLLDFEKEGNLSLTKIEVNSSIFNNLINGNTYKIKGEGTLKKTFSIRTLGLDHLLLLIYGRLLTKTDENNYVKVYLSVDEVNSEKFKINDLKDTYEILSLNQTCFNSSDKVLITIEFKGEVEIILGNLELFYKETLNYDYDDDHNLISVGDKSKGENYSYNEKGELENKVDINNNSNSYSYGNFGEPVRILLPYGISEIYKYDKNYKTNVIEKIKINEFNEEYFIENYSYSDDGRFITAYKDSLGNITKINNYDKYGNIGKIITPNNVTSNYLRYIDGDVSRFTLSKNNDKSNTIYSYDSQKNLILVLNNNDSSYIFDYDGNHNLINVKLNQIIINKYEYDLNNINITKIRYGENGDSYKFNYDNDNRLIQIDYLNDKEKIEHSYKYVYNGSNELIKVTDGYSYLIKEYNYDLEGRISSISNNEYKISYNYNNFNNVNMKKVNIRNKILDYSYSYVNSSSGSNANSLKDSLKNINVFIGIYQNDLNLVNLNKVIKPLGNTESNDLKIKGEPFRYALINSTHGLSYRLENLNKKDFPIGNISFWFKIPYFNGTIDKHYLFSIKQLRHSNNHSKILVYIRDKKLHLELTDFNGKVYDVLTFSKHIKYNEWNFFSLNYYNRDDGLGYDDICRYELFINGEKELYEKANPRLCLDLEDFFEIKFGFDIDQPSLYCDEVRLASLFIAHNENINIGDIYKFYRYTKDYLIDNQLIEDDIKTVNFSSTNLYQINTNIFQENYRVYPLNNSLNSLDGHKPLIFDTRQISYLDKNRIFNFNKINKHYAYIADGNRLVYDFNLNTKGTIAMKLYLDGYYNKQYILETIDSTNKGISIYRDYSKRVIISTPRITINTNLVIEDNKLTDFIISYDVNNIGNTLNKNVNLRLVINNKSFEQTIFSTLSFVDMKFMVGRKFYTEIENTIFGDYQTSYPLNGLIEMVVTSNEFMSISNMLKIYDSIGSIDKIKQFDSFSMLKKEEINSFNKNILSKTYYYKNINLAISNLIKEEKFKINGESFIRTFETDSLGRVTKINDSIFGSHTYQYDYRGFLIKEDNKIYNYDQYGNIILKDKTKLTYDTSIKDRLASIDGISVTYNNKSPLIIDTYKTNRLYFEGRRLSRFVKGSMFYDFEYDDKGVRTLKKDMYGNSHKYIYEGNKLINEKTNDYELDFLYDENNILYGFIKDKVEIYYYVRDSLGNILGIIDSLGTLVAKYVLDAFGKIISIKGTSANTIGKINPFRYKGYYFDDETKLYYLISRYYDPETGRFITPDSISNLELENINGLNLFSYCKNDPVNLVDPFGTFSLISYLIGLGVSTFIGAIIGATSYAVSEVVSFTMTGNWNWSWSEFFGNTIGGAIGGSLEYVFHGHLSIFTNLLADISSTVFGMFFQNNFEGANNSRQDIINAAIISTILSIEASVLGKMIKIEGINLGKNSYFSISKQVFTKFRKGTITRISDKTFMKIFKYKLVENIANIVFNTAIDEF